MKKLRLLLITLCVTALMGSMAVTAYAGGGEEWDGLAPVEPLPAETVDPGEGFTEDGNLVTRDLLYDEATNKQFITVQTSGGNTFYIVIDYDKPTDEDGEQYHTYFLNMVDEADLLAALEAAGGELPACSCTEKCAPGVIHTDCEVCAVNMTECAGTAPEPAPVTEPAEEPEPEPQQKSNTGTLLLILAVAGLGGGGGGEGATNSLPPCCTYRGFTALFPSKSIARSMKKLLYPKRITVRNWLIMTIPRTMGRLGTRTIPKARIMNEIYK